MRQIEVTARTLAPVVLSAENNGTVMVTSRHYISGSVLRGVLAGKYVDARNLGRIAHEDAEFRKLFFGSLRFVDATPAAGYDGERSFAVPLSIQRGKAGSGDDGMVDLLYEKPAKGYKSLYGYCTCSGEGLRQEDVDTEICLHMSRAGAKERLSGSSRDGGIFSYESVSSGQFFKGAIIGEEEDLSALMKIIGNKSLRVHIGRSRYAQYGECLLHFSSAREIPSISPGSAVEDELFIRLDTVYLPEPGYEGNAVKSLSLVADSLSALCGGERFSIGKVFAAPSEVDNFVGVWGMKRPRAVGLAPGSVFSLKKEGGAWSEEDCRALSGLIYGGIGLRREEGFGQMRIWTGAKCKKETQMRSPRPSPAAKPEIPNSVSTRVAVLVKSRIKEQLRIYADEDVKRLGIDASMSHFFSRLQNILSAACGKENMREGVRGLLEAERSHGDGKEREAEKSDTPFTQNMKKVAIHSSSLDDILRKGKPSPYEERDVFGDLCPASMAAGSGGEKTETIEELLKEVEMSPSDFDMKKNEFFNEYWSWFCYFARKRAAGKKGDF